MKSRPLLRAVGFGIAILGLTACAASPPPPRVESPPPGVRIYVANESSNDVTVVDGATFTVVGTVDAKNYSTHDLALTRAGRTLFATKLASGRLSVIDTTSLET